MNIHMPDNIGEWALKSSLESCRLVLGTLRRLPRWRCICCCGSVALLLLLSAALWQTANIRAADPQDQPSGQTAQSSPNDAAGQDQSKQDAQNEKTGDKPKPGAAQPAPTLDQNKPGTPPATGAAAAAKPAAPPRVEPLTAEKRRMFDLFAQLSQAKLKDPNSPEVAALEKQLDEAIAAVEKVIQSDPNVKMNVLPAGPPDKGPQAAEAPTKTAADAVPPEPADSGAAAAKTVPPDPNLDAKQPILPATGGHQDEEPPPPGSGEPADRLPTQPDLNRQPPAERSIPVREVPPHEQDRNEIDRSRSQPPAQRSIPVREVPPHEQDHNEADRSRSQVSSETPPAAAEAAPAETAILLVDASDRADPNIPAGSPDDLVRLKIEENLLDVAFLIETIGKEMDLNFLYESTEPVTGKVLFQQYGEIRRKDLLPLLESILGFQGFTMIREGSVVRIVKRDANLLKRFQPRIVIDQQMPEVAPGDTVIAQIIQVQHASVAEVQRFIVNFVSDPSAVKAIPGTNYLIITEFVNRLGRILELVKLIDHPGVPRRLERIHVEHLRAQEAKQHLDVLLKALIEQGVMTDETEEEAIEEPAADAQPKTAAEIREERAKRLLDARRAASGSPAAASPSTPKGAMIYVYERANDLLLIGTDQQILEVKNLLALLDVEPPRPDIYLEPIRVRFVTAASAAAKVRDLLNSLNQMETPSAGAAETPAEVKTDAAGRAAPRLPTARPPAATTPTAAAAGPDSGPAFHVDERTNRILLVGSRQQIAQVKELLALIDVEAGPEITLEVLSVDYVEPDVLAGQIQSLIQALNASGGDTEAGSTPTDRSAPPENAPARQTPTPPSRLSAAARARADGETPMLYDKQAAGPALFVDKRTRRLFVVGSADQIEQVKELKALLDVVAGPEIRLEVLTVEHVTAGDVAVTIEKLIRALNESDRSNVEPFAPATATPASATAHPAGAAVPTPTGRERITGRAGQEAATSETVSADSPAIFVDERTNRLLIVGSDEQIKQVKEILALLDVVEGPEVKVTVLRVEHVIASEVAGQIEDIIDALNEKSGSPGEEDSDRTRLAPAAAKPTETIVPPGRTPLRSGTTTRRTGESIRERGPALFVDDRTNRILVVGSDEQLAQVKELLALLDVQEGPEIQLVAVPVTYVLAGEVADEIRDLIDALNEQDAHRPGAATGAGSTAGGTAASTRREGLAATAPDKSATTERTTGRTTAEKKRVESPGPAIFADERTNRLLVVGSAEQIEQFKGILALLDVKEGPAIRLETFLIRHVVADDLATQLESLLDAFTQQEGLPIRPTGGSARGPSASVVTTTSAAATGDTAAVPPRARAEKSDSRSSGSSEQPGPFVLVDGRTNRLLVVGSDKQIQQLSDLLIVLDVPPSEYYRLILKVYQPQFVEAAEVQRILDALGITETERTAPRDEGRTDTAKTRTAETGSTTEGRTATAAGTAATGATETGFFTREPGEGLLLPGQEEPQVRLAVQETNNKIYVLATEYQHRDIAEILKHVDVQPDDDLGAMRIYPLENREPSVVTQMLQDLFEAEKEAKEAASGGVEKIVTIPGKEGAPIVVSLEDIYAVAVRGSKKQHEEIAELVKTLDKRLPSVLVEAILVQVNTDDVLNLGISLQQKSDVGTSQKRTISGVSPFGISPTRSGDLIVGTGGTLAYFDDNIVYATLEALQTTGNSKVASMPRVLVNDNEEGSISNRRLEPTTRTTIPAGSDTPIIEFDEYVEAGTTLSITPHISEGDFLKLTITLDVDSFDGKGSQNVPPPKSVNNVTTTVTVPNGKFIVLGGLTSQTESNTINKVPILGDIPLLGMAFRNVARSDTEAILYVFVRANIVGRHEEFEDLDTLSEKYRQKLRDSETNYQWQSIIPGIKDDHPIRPNVLDR
ncbi:MAG: hypothetical protein JW810_07300 [Sedimentisphaerales bacterium]|nr:hypothetical protein [Sedimentisphaerales bacterium]